MYYQDTITAIATPPGLSGIGIIRISGPESLKIAAGLFRSKNFRPDRVVSHHLYHGVIIDPADDCTVDEVLLAYMRAPGSYTGEDIVEINTHGGLIILQKTLSLVCQAGARIAEPGEFTRRAFCNGRIDLAQAEAVMDIIEAKTEAGLKLASRALTGGLSEKIRGIAAELIAVTAHLEASIDFPEDDIDPQHAEVLARRLSAAADMLQQLLATGEQGLLYRYGVQAVIAGKPNVGKSSILNALLGEYRAIVTPFPGTTRDVIQETISIQGIPIRLVDTAGLRESDNEIEKIGIDMTRSRLQEADLVLLVLDGCAPLDSTDTAMLQMLRKRKCIILVNKADLPQAFATDDLQKIAPDMSCIALSALTHQGIDLLRDSIARTVMHDRICSSTNILITNARHKGALEKAGLFLQQAHAALLAHLPPELVAADLQAALSSLGEITGETTADDILDVIFSTFCIGK